MNRFWLASGLAALFCFWISPVAAAAEFPTGTFRASNQKDWSIKFEDKGKFTVSSGATVVVEGNYKASEAEVTLTDEKGRFAAKDDASKVGMYKWKLDGGKLKFTLIEDRSKGRELLLTSNVWELQK